MHRSFWIRNIEGFSLLVATFIIVYIINELMKKESLSGFIQSDWPKDGTTLSKIGFISFLLVAVGFQIFLIGGLLLTVLGIASWLGRRFPRLRWLQYLENQADATLGKFKAAWLRKPAARGDVPAQTPLGEIYEQGLGVAQNYDESLHWYRMAADQGDRDAQMKLGYLYWQGRGAPRDQSEALRCFRQAALRGDAVGQTIMGDNCAGYIVDVSGEKREDFDEAFRWYRMAADQGHSGAQCMLGALYEEGKGVERHRFQALRWYHKAAKQGHANAQLQIGYCCYDMGLLAGRDERQAVRFWREALRAWRKSADRGNDSAQMAIGEMYWTGRGVAQDRQEALVWFRKGAEKNAQFAEMLAERLKFLETTPPSQESEGEIKQALRATRRFRVTTSHCRRLWESLTR
jgi:TPR repeat protein